MKNNKLTFLKIAIVAVLGFATVLGCEKKDVLQEEQTKNELKSEVSVKVLSEYLAKKINAKLDWISFDQQTEMFRLHDVDQISRKDLTEMYQRSLLNP